MYLKAGNYNKQWGHFVVKAKHVLPALWSIQSGRGNRYSSNNYTNICRFPALKCCKGKFLIPCMQSCFSPVRLCVTLWAPLSMGFSRLEYWSRLQFPSPMYLHNPGTELGSPTLQSDSLLSDPPGKPRDMLKRIC